MLRVLTALLVLFLASLLGVWLHRTPQARRIGCALARISLFLSLLITLLASGLGPGFVLVTLPFLLVLFLVGKRFDAGWMLLPFSLPFVFLAQSVAWYALVTSLSVYAFASALASGKSWQRIVTRRFAFAALVLVLLFAQAFV